MERQNIMTMDLTDYSKQQAVPAPRSSECLNCVERGRILVVDDDASIRVALRAVLENAGYDVAVAQNGLHALLQVGLAAEKPSVVILDLAMPGLDGLEVMEAFDRLTWSVKPAVIVLTANGSKANSTRAAALGASAVLAKPIAPAQLLEVVKQSLASRHECIS